MGFAEPVTLLADQELTGYAYFEFQYEDQGGTAAGTQWKISVGAEGNAEKTINVDAPGTGTEPITGTGAHNQEPAPIFDRVYKTGDGLKKGGEPYMIWTVPLNPNLDPDLSAGGALALTIEDTFETEMAMMPLYQINYGDRDTVTDTVLHATGSNGIFKADSQSDNIGYFKLYYVDYEKAWSKTYESFGGINQPQVNLGGKTLQEYLTEKARQTIPTFDPLTTAMTWDTYKYFAQFYNNTYAQVLTVFQAALPDTRTVFTYDTYSAVLWSTAWADENASAPLGDYGLTPVPSSMVKSITLKSGGKGFTIKMAKTAFDDDATKGKSIVLFYATKPLMDTETTQKNKVTFSGSGGSPSAGGQIDLVQSGGGASSTRKLFTFYKENASETPLPDAKFELFEGATRLGEAISGTSGDLNFEVAQKKENVVYKLKELTPPTGYEPLGQEIYFIFDKTAQKTIPTDASGMALNPIPPYIRTIDGREGFAVVNTPTSGTTPLTVDFGLSKRLFGADGVEVLAGLPAFTFEAKLLSNNKANVTGLDSNKTVTLQSEQDGSMRNLSPVTIKAAGTYKFGVVEVQPGSPDGYERDLNVITVTIVVKEDSGALVVESKTYTKNGYVLTPTNENNSEFVNKEKDGLIEFFGLKVVKTLSTNLPSFDFRLTYLKEETTTANGGEQPDPLIGNGGIYQNAADGKITFDNIKVNQAGKYVFGIEEIIPANTSGYQFDQTKFMVTVTVDAALEVANVKVEKRTAGSPEMVPDLKFTNVPKQYIQVKKVDAKDPTKALPGAVFELYDFESSSLTNPMPVDPTNSEVTGRQRGTLIATVTTGADGIATFELPFDSAQNAYKWDEHQFTIVEQTPPSQYTSEKVGEIVFRVDEDGKISGAAGSWNNWLHDKDTQWLTGAANWKDQEVDKKYVTMEGDQITFVVKNDPKTTTPPSGGGNPAPASVTLSATKTLDGKQPGDVKFSFQLKDSSGKVLETVQNTSGGQVTFSSLEFKNAGTYNYTISEVVGTEGYTYDNKSYAVTIEVTEGSSRLNATVSYEQKGGGTGATAPTFENKTIPATELTQISVKKVWEVGAGQSYPASVTVQLFENGTAYGPSVTLNTANNWSYTWDKLDSKKNWSVDEVAVPEGYTKAISKDGTVYTITNRHNEHTPDRTPARVILGANKTYNGGLPGNAAFQFILFNEAGVQIETKRNNERGTVSFSEISYNQVGTYRYRIEEVAGSVPVINYDTSAYEVEVVIGLEGDRYVLSSLNYYLLDANGNRGTALGTLPTFQNTSRPVTPEDPEEFVEVDEDGTPLGSWVPDENGEWVFVPDEDVPLGNGNLPQTGDSAPVFLFTMLTVLCGVGSVGLLVTSRVTRRRH